MPYRQVQVTSATPVAIQLSTDTRPYQLALLSMEGGTVRLVTDGQAPTATFGKQLFAGERNQRVEGAGNVRQGLLIAESTTATVGIDLQVHVH